MNVLDVRKHFIHARNLRRDEAKRAVFTMCELLGWRAETPFEDGLRATIDWYLANRAEAERVAA